MPVISDEEFGDITVRRSGQATHVRIRVAPDGRLRASVPLYAPLYTVKRLIKNSRPELRTMLAETQADTHYEDGMQIGKSHSLVVRRVTQSPLSVKRHGQQLIVRLPEGSSLNDPPVTRVIRDTVIDVLRIESKSYLPKRLAFLANKYGFSYEKVRFSHASSRWGSCSSAGTISLNIALMKLPFELIDYVIIHELSHTIHMDHSEAFWQCVAEGDPHYKTHRAALRKMTPTI